MFLFLLIELKKNYKKIIIISVLNKALMKTEKKCIRN
jgi:hypothetical protein